jgi:hypothetical protein
VRRSPNEPDHLPFLFPTFALSLLSFAKGIHRCPKRLSSKPPSSLAHFDRQCLPRRPEKLPPEKPLPRLPDLRPPGRPAGKRSFRLLVPSAKRSAGKAGIAPFTEVCLPPIVSHVRQMGVVFGMFSLPTTPNAPHDGCFKNLFLIWEPKSLVGLSESASLGPNHPSPELLFPRVAFYSTPSPIQTTNPST